MPGPVAPLSYVGWLRPPMNRHLRAAYIGPSLGCEPSQSREKALHENHRHAPTLRTHPPPREAAIHDILLISGTRPEIVKLAPVWHALREQGWTGARWLHTAQHGDMAAGMLGSFDIAPDITLSRPGRTLVDFSVACRVQLDAVMQQKPWSLVIVQGDTESAFQGALAAFYHQVPLAHVEAGLRTHNLARPFPEEGLRQMISRIARLQFAPTAGARDALRAEGIAPASVHLTGNTVVDAQHWIARRHGIARRVSGRGHLLVTAHRRENWGGELAEICHAVADIATLFPGLDILFPVHLNPVVREPVHAILGPCPSVRLVPPLDYLAMQQALADAWLLLTDSGGLQEEAPTFGVPVLVLREETERPEAVAAGCARIVGANRRRIVDTVRELAGDAPAFARMQRAGNPFGDGEAAPRIVASIEAHFARRASEKSAPSPRTSVSTSASAPTAASASAPSAAPASAPSAAPALAAPGTAPPFPEPLEPALP